MLQKKEYQQQQRYQNNRQNLMLQKKEYQQQQKLPTTTKIPVTPTKSNVTKEGITTTTTKIPVTPTKSNVTKEGIPTTTKIPSNTNKN